MKTKVHIIESEKGWGRKIDEVKEFDSREDAIDFCEQYNAGLKFDGDVPDWYMFAKLEGDDLFAGIRMPKPPTKIYCPFCEEGIPVHAVSDVAFGDGWVIRVHKDGTILK